MSSQRDIKEPECGFQTKVLPFGSHALGLSTIDSDIDVVCIAPLFVSRDDFFKSFSEVIRNMTDFKQLRIIEGARVPLIDVHFFENIKVDLLFCQINEPIVPAIDDLTCDDILSKMDITSIYSLNGIRESLLLSQLVDNHNIFKEAVLIVKHWAKCHFVHHAVLGFLGGFSWCILVAYVCKDHSDISLAALLRDFFVTYSAWDWTKPVKLKPQVQSHTKNQGVSEIFFLTRVG